MPKAIIMGVTGQDGSFLAEFLLGLGYQVVGVGRRSSIDNRGRLSAALESPDFLYVEGDVSDPWSMLKIIHDHAEPDLEVYNLAAQSHVGTSFEQPDLTWKVVAGGCLNILEAIRLHCPTARFYQASSSEMFGREFSMMQSGHMFQNEVTPFAPQSPYAIAKVAAHHTTQLYRRAYGLHASCGILFNHESERRLPTFVTRKITSYIGRLVAVGLAAYEMGSDRPSLLPLGDFPKLKLGNLDAHRDWGYAPDYVIAMHAMLQLGSPDDYVIASGETHKVREFLSHAFSLVGISNWSEYVEIDDSLLRPAEVPYLCGSYAKAKEKLGWEPTTSFQQLVEIMVDGDL